MFDEKNENINSATNDESSQPNLSQDGMLSDASSSISQEPKADNHPSQQETVISAENLFAQDTKYADNLAPQVNEDAPTAVPQAPEQSSSGYVEGTAYTSNVDGNSKQGYEWNGEGVKTSVNKKNKSSDKGFKIFVGTMLSVFTLSVLVLTCLVVSHVVGGYVDFDASVKINGEQIIGDSQDNSSGNAQITNPGVSASASNYVVYDSELKANGHLTIPEIAAKCSPSSVGIISEIEVSYSYPFGFGTQTGVSEASGSGFVYSADGYIITNHHVIENATKVTVILHDSKQYEAEVIGSDSLSDIAVLKITPDNETKLVPMEIGNSDELVVGESVVAIGCPAGIEFIGTVTDGIVSAINRNVEISDNYGSTQKTMTLIQTNATINHGNSGGPLINTRGQVIGINTLKLNSSSYEGIGFSIPMNGAMPIIKQLIEHGKVIERTQEDFAYGKGIIGISGSPISEDEAEYYNIPLGVLVVQIDKNSSAARAGLRRGDIITHYNGKEVTTVQEINDAKGSARAGEEVTVTVYRDSEDDLATGETIDITFKLDAQQ